MEKFPDSPAARREILRAGERHHCWGDVLAVAYFRGAAAALHPEVADALAATRYAEEEGFDVPGDAGEAGDAFRLEHELISGEDLERWLDHVGLTLEQFDAHFASRALLERFRDRLADIRRDYAPAEGGVLEGMWAATLLAGRFEEITLPFARRLAAWLESGGTANAEGAARFLREGGDRIPAPLRSPGLAEEMAAAEAAYTAEEAGCATPEALARELRSRAFDLTRLAFAVAAFPSLDQAREARLAVSEDGRGLAEVAGEAGGEFRSMTVFPDEVPEATRPLLLSAAPGVPLEPEETAEGFVVRVLEGRIEPALTDPRVASRIRSRLIDARFETLLERHLAWSFDPWVLP